jgi:hypothetical protein
MQSSIYILSRNPNNSMYIDWVDKYPIKIKFIQSYSDEWEPPKDAGLIISHDAYRKESCSALFKSINRNIPTLILADGILEYRNCWIKKHETIYGVFNPIPGHKLACIGNSQARHVAAWNEPNTCEVVGLVRNTRFYNVFKGVNHNGGILICTSNNPWFNSKEQEQVINYFKRLRDVLNNLKHDIYWRIHPELAESIKVASTHKLPLQLDIERSRIAFCMPSTVLLECMLSKRPSCLLNIFNTPHYVNCAWHLNSVNSVFDTIADMINPPVEKIRFQNIILRDHLQIHEPPINRLFKLISIMHSIGDQRDSNDVVKLLNDCILTPI